LFRRRRRNKRIEAIAYWVMWTDPFNASKQIVLVMSIAEIKETILNYQAESHQFTLLEGKTTDAAPTSARRLSIAYCQSRALLSSAPFSCIVKHQHKMPAQASEIYHVQHDNNEQDLGTSYSD